MPRMYRVALRIVGDPERAQEVVQDACVRAIRSKPAFGGRAMLSTWLHRITVNCARDHLRQANQGGAVQSALDINLGTIGRSQATPAALAEQRELVAIALQLVAELPDDCRSAFILTQLDGYSYDEAAAIERQPRGTIASRVFRAKKMLLERLAGRWAEE